jgi:hypothetical protein
MVEDKGRMVERMALNIKNEEVHRLAAKLAAQRGVSMSELVLELLKEEESRITSAQQAKIERMLALARESSKFFDPGFKSTDIDELLYDEDGLPR